MDSKIERRLTYEFGVNKNQTIISGFSSFEWLHKLAIERTYGPVDIVKREQREVLTIVTDWEEV